MIKSVAFGLAAGAAVQAWRQWPADGPVTTTSGVLVMVVGIVLAYLAGRRRGGGATAVAVATATAVADATAVANQQVHVPVQVAVVVPGQGAGASSRLVDELPWAKPAPAVTADSLDGQDLSDLFPEYDPAELDGA